MQLSTPINCDVCFCPMQEKLEKELRDARARELMHAEEAAILDKVESQFTNYTRGHSCRQQVHRKHMHTVIVFLSFS